jgi:hypothetical protein
MSAARDLYRPTDQAGLRLAALECMRNGLTVRDTSVALGLSVLATEMLLGAVHTESQSSNDARGAITQG